jgi:hypothetical protein
MKKSIIILIIFLILLACLIGFLAGSSRIYGFNNTGRALNGGIAWNIGGIEIYPTFSFFICPGNYRSNGTFWSNPLINYFPELVTDC